jgi:DNA-binding NarL/FixJ family response regulator
LSDAPQIFVIDPHAIFRAGLIACLASLPGIGSVDGANTPEEAWERETLLNADLILLDRTVGQMPLVIAQLHHRVGCPITAMTETGDISHVLEAVEAGAVGVLCTTGLGIESLGVQVRAALHGAGVIPPQLLTALVDRSRNGSGAGHDGSHNGALTTREQLVLRLIADGKLTREIAHELAYSERTVKTVLHDALVKLGARSRSQAVANAVRGGLI